MPLNFKPDTPKELIFEHVAEYLHLRGLKISVQDSTRPWGGFFVIEEKDAEKFIQLFFSDLSAKEFNSSGKLSPKILIVEPGKRLSWQYHNRRSEVWKLIGGTAGIISSNTDEEKNNSEFKTGDTAILKQGERHRLVGTETWGIIAEIWCHTDPANPSNEDDIVRIQDDFGR